MKIVIDIPEVFYEYCKAEEGAIEVHLAIKNGIPLPKGHGDLIDRNELAVDYTSSDWNDYVSVEQIKNAKAIVEAYKEGAEE